MANNLNRSLPSISASQKEMCDKYAASFVASAGTSSFTASGVNLHHGEIEDAAIRAVIQDGNEIKLQVDVVGLDLTALIDTRQVVE